MKQVALRVLLRGAAVALAVLALALAAPPGAHAKDKKAKSVKVKSVKVKSVKVKPAKAAKDDPSREDIDLGRDGHGRVRRIDAKRGGNRAGSDPTTVPIVDDDFLLMAVWTRMQIRADAAHALNRGAGVHVAVLDGGFDLEHPDLAGHLSPWGYDAIDEDFDPQDEGNGIDDEGDGHVDGGVGHGTFVSGMILLAAPDAVIVPIRIRDDEGWGTNAELERGLEYALAMGVDVVNVSGQATHGRSQGVSRLIAALRARGVVVVTSAGNEGTEEVSEVGDDEDALRVGAVGPGDVLASFSNTTSDPSVRMLLAPGVDLYGPLGGPLEGSHGYWSGTSFSAALVSGGAALVRARWPWLPAQEVMTWLAGTTDPAWDRAGRMLPFGRLNLLKAVTR